MAKLELTSTWLDEYEKLMFGDGHSIETMEKASALKLAHMPPVLYKYRSCSENTIEALENDCLYSSVPSEFNDIFEGAITIEKDEVQEKNLQKFYNEFRLEHPFLPNASNISFDDLLKNITSGMGHSYEEVVHDPFLQPIWIALKDFCKETGNRNIEQLEALARDAYNICCFASTNDNALMWAHYGDNNKGFCIGYGIKELNNEMTHLTFPVIYTEKKSHGNSRR